MIEGILYFLFVMLGLGFSVWKLFKLEEKDDITKFFMYIAVGLVSFIQLSLVLGFFHLSNWLIYLVITCILLVIVITRNKIKIVMPKVDRRWAIVFVLFFIHFAVYLQGAFIYPWLEDDDPWAHATAVRYIAETGTFIQPDHLPIHYLAPYPPSYDMIMGTIFQADGNSVQFVLKFFNALLVSLAIPFFYLWAKEKFGGSVAIWAAFILTAIPCFMSHFIWAQTLAMILVFPSLYFIDKYRQNKQKETMILGVFATAGVLVTQPSTAVMFGGFLGVYVLAQIVASFLETKKFEIKITKETVIIGGLALLLAIVEFWGPMFIMYPTDKVLEQNSFSQAMITDKYGDTGGGLIYGLMDFIDAPKTSKMDQPVGLGIGISVLLVIGIIFALISLKNEKHKELSILIILWVVYGFIGTEGNALPVKLVPHRFWVFLAVTVAIAAGFGASKLLEYAVKRGKSLVYLTMIFIVGTVALYSADAKLTVETSMWPPGVSWVTQEQLAGYVNLNKVLPKHTKVFNFCGNEDFVNGFDLYGYPWIKEVTDYKKISINDSVEENYMFLKKYNYSYAVIDGSCLEYTTNEFVITKLDKMEENNGFEFQQQLSNNAFLVFKIY
ncbi:MAG: DUF6541 family protein [Candidatus Micrarchaeota archaeon]